MRYLFAIFLILLVTPLSASGQVGVTRERSYVGDKLASIPDPNSDLAIVSFACNTSVAKAAKLPQATVDAVAKLLKESGGSLSSPSVSYSYSRTSGLPFENPSATEIKTQLDALKIKNSIQIAAIIDAGQMQRLRQAVYQIEIVRSGLDGALVDGFLGQELGIRSDQKQALRTIAESVEDKANVELARMIREEWMKFFLNLPVEQQERMKELVGTPFPLCSKLVFRPSTPVADPDDILEMSALLSNNLITDELHLGDEKNDIVKLLSPFCPRGDIANFNVKQLLVFGPAKKEELKDKLLEIIDPRQAKRLSEIGYQIEIERKGLGESVTEGFLGRRAGVNNDQRLSLRTHAESTEVNIDNARTKLIAESQSTVLKHLEPLQRIKANKLLELPFAFRENWNK